MDTEPNNLRQAMAAAAEPQASPPGGSEVERLIATGDRMLRVQQARLTGAWTDHDRNRTERLSWYRAEMQRIADEAEAELLALDQRWHSQRRAIEAVIAKLKAMRAA